MRVIGLLHLWGSCVHFGGSEVLSEYLVVDPTFLTQKILGSLFDPKHARIFSSGVLPHEGLKLIWPEKYHEKAEFLLALMEKFEVCFELGDRTQQQQQQQDSPPHQPKKDSGIGRVSSPATFPSNLPHPISTQVCGRMTAPRERVSCVMTTPSTSSPRNW